MCHLKKLVRPETFGPYYVCMCVCVCVYMSLGARGFSQIFDRRTGILVDGLSKERGAKKKK